MNEFCVKVACDGFWLFVRDDVIVVLHTDWVHLDPFMQGNLFTHSVNFLLFSTKTSTSVSAERFFCSDILVP